MLDRRRNQGCNRQLTTIGIFLALLVPLLGACGGEPATIAHGATSDAATSATPASPRATLPVTVAQPTRTTIFVPGPATAPSGTAVRASATTTRGSGTSTVGGTARSARGGLAGTALTALAVGGPDGQLLFAGGRGLWRSTDGGRRWETVRGATEAPRVVAIAIAPSDQQVVYVGVSEGCGRGGRNPGFVSTDGGARWQESGQNIGSLAVDPFDAKKVWATTCTGVQRSTDGGATWEPARGAQLDLSTPSSIALVPGIPRVVYVAYASEGGTAKVRRTIDDGATWQDTQLPAAAFGPLALTTDPGKADSVFLSTLVGIFRSRDGGQSWTLLADGLEATQPARPPANAPDGFRLTGALVAAPDASDTFWVGTGAGATPGIGIFGTRDGGATWQRISGGIDGRTIGALALGVTRNERILYAATDDGVWTLSTPNYYSCN